MANMESMQRAMDTLLATTEDDGALAEEMYDFIEGEGAYANCVWHRLVKDVHFDKRLLMTVYVIFKLDDGQYVEMEFSQARRRGTIRSVSSAYAEEYILSMVARAIQKSVEPVPWLGEGPHDFVNMYCGDTVFQEKKIIQNLCDLKVKRAKTFSLGSHLTALCTHFPTKEREMYRVLVAEEREELTRLGRIFCTIANEK